jgi:hypothetical protein
MRPLSLLGVSLLPPLILSLAVIFSPHTGVLSFQIISRRQELILRTDATRSSATATATTTTTRLITTSTTSSKSSSLSLSSNNNNGDDDDDDDSSSHPYEYDLAVIGAGPVGVQAAIAAASQMLSSSDSGNPSNRKRKVVLIDAPRASGKLMNEETNEDLSIGGPTGELRTIFFIPVFYFNCNYLLCAFVDTKVVLRWVVVFC